tara:strand:+ start:956 stop:1216 length:261 start_codon:yes stop_codon:yes gene_type:complete
MGKRQRHWQFTAAVLERFGPTVSTARRRYREFIVDGIERRARVDYSCGVSFVAMEDGKKSAGRAGITNAGLATSKSWATATSLRAR